MDFNYNAPKLKRLKYELSNFRYKYSLYHWYQWRNIDKLDESGFKFCNQISVISYIHTKNVEAM